MTGDGTWQPIRAGLTKMTLRERWNRTMHFQPVDRLPHLEFGYWRETLPAWHEQGLPASVDDEKQAYAYFGIEDWVKAPVVVDIYPPFEEEIIEENGAYILCRDVDRALRKEISDGIRTIPHYVEFGLKSRDDWKLFKE